MDPKLDSPVKTITDNLHESTTPSTTTNASTMRIMNIRLPLVGTRRLPLRIRFSRNPATVIAISVLLWSFYHLPAQLSTPSSPSSTQFSQALLSSTQSATTATRTFGLPRLFEYFKPKSGVRKEDYEELEWGDEDYGSYAAQVLDASGETRPSPGGDDLPPTDQSISDNRVNRINKHHHVAESFASPTHPYRSDGLLDVNPDAKHPVLDLMATSEERWTQKMKRASKTLKEAVVEYRRRYNRMPPKGFDRWWDYVVNNHVQLPDEYDQIFHDLEPFWGMKPTYVREMQAGWEGTDEVGTYTIVNDADGVRLATNTLSEKDANVGYMRAKEQMILLQDVYQFIPPFRATFTAHDGPNQFIGYDLKSEAAEAALISEYVDPRTENIFENRRRGWGFACPETSALRSQDPFQPFNETALWHQPKTFIWDHKASMDPCLQPSHVHLSGFLSAFEEGPVPRKTFVPSFTMSTTPLHADILAVAMEMWTDDVGEDPVWAEKPYDRLLWRGSNTGTYFGEDTRWNISQRVRLVRKTNANEGFLDVLPSPENEDEPVGKAKPSAMYDMNLHFMDIGFSGRAIQCDPAICEYVETQLRHKRSHTYVQANQWKYVLDVDGNGWSARFKRLMTSNSLVFKSTIFPEWYTDRVQPWVHYIPIKNDFTDLYDVFMFFHGDVGHVGGHDDLAEKIATRGKEWSLNFWRKQDMTAYMFRLFLEYSRVMSLDREGATMQWEDVR